MGKATAYRSKSKCVNWRCMPADSILWRPEPDSPLDGPMGKFVFSK